MRNILLLILAAYLTGCAVGNKYSYESTSMSIPFETENSSIFVLLVEDLRPYVLDGKKEPNFVGLQRGGYGNPFDVTTESGKSLTNAMSKAISDGLENAGYTVIIGQKGNIDQLVNTAANNGASRIIILEVFDWKSDLYAHITMHVNLKLRVYHANGDLLAEASTRFTKSIGAALIGEQANSNIVTAEFEKQVRLLFGHDKIKDALNNEQGDMKTNFKSSATTNVNSRKSSSDNSAYDNTIPIESVMWSESANYYVKSKCGRLEGNLTFLGVIKGEERYRATCSTGELMIIGCSKRGCKLK